ncbi:translation termination factor GTPase eRF3 [Ascosphaera aggregata]|nr:translation termination factor GTPase eRF3 [Ascosphaera aggregata]
MSGLDSWEDDPAAQDENLSRQAQQSLNLNSAQAPSFRPGVASFTPGAPAFTPGQQFAGYGYQQYPQYQQGYYQQPYGQYNQQQYYNQYHGQYPATQQGYSQQAHQQQPAAAQQQQWRQQAIAKPPAAGSAAAASAPAPATAEQPHKSAPPKVAVKPSAKAAPSSPKVTAASPKIGVTKVLSIGGDVGGGSSAAVKVAEAKLAAAATESGSKVTAKQAIDKTEKGQKKSSGGKSSPAPSSGRSSPGRGNDRSVDAVKEQQADVDEATLKEIYGEKKEHINLIFIGHVDAGKSTLGGSILYATGMVDERTMDKYRREAKEAGRETWYLSWALDLNPEERSKGKTVEVGRGFFKTTGDTPDGPVERTYTILDAPGHKSYVPNMIGGASQADVAVLVISARKGEYETGFEKGGQTREHALLARNSGVTKLIVAVNKMDDQTVEWSQARFNECTVKIAKYLEALGYKKEDLTFMPISAQKTIGIDKPVPKDICPWYNGPGLLPYLHNMKMPERKLNAPFMMPISAKYRDMGTMIEGRIESGIMKKGSTYIMMPNRESVTITALYAENEDEIQTATCGDQVRCRVRGIEEEDIMPGFVLCSPRRPVHCVKSFEAKIRLLELKTLLSAGFDCVLHVHSAIEEVTFSALLHKLQKETGRRSKKPPAFAKKGDTIIARLEVTGAAGAVCVERYEDYNQLGRFTLRDQGQTIAIGMVTKLITEEVVAEEKEAEKIAAAAAAA